MSPNNEPIICVPVCAASERELENLISQVASEGDWIEIRLDCMSSAALEEVSPHLTQLIHQAAAPVIITLRSPSEGGRQKFDEASRKRFWLSEKPDNASFYDIESTLASELASHHPQALDWSRVICSHHDFNRVPPDLEKIYERMTRTPARILKIAAQATDITDCLPIFRLLERARNEGRELIAIAMGQAGIVTRILGSSRGSFLTYGALASDSATAPGQITARELKTVYRLDKVNRETALMGLVGLPVSHSFSPRIHNAAFAALGQNAVVVPFEVRDLAGFMQRMVRPSTREIEWKLQGLSVTAPHKSSIMGYLDWVEPAARELGAINTVVIRDQALHGYNTDAAAFIESLRETIGDLKERRCAIVGAGGAARAAVWGLRKEGAEVTIFSRDQIKGQELAKQFAVEWQPLAGGKFTDFLVVVNATPLGTSGHLEAETVATADQLRGTSLVYDLVYNPQVTRFMQEAREAGCETLGGLNMLVRQAMVQFRLWTGLDAPARTMEEAAAKALAEKSLVGESH